MTALGDHLAAQLLALGLDRDVAVAVADDVAALAADEARRAAAAATRRERVNGAPVGEALRQLELEVSKELRGAGPCLRCQAGILRAAQRVAARHVGEGRGG